MDPLIEEQPSLDKLQVLTTAVQDLSLARTLSEVTAIVRAAARQLTGADGATFVLRDGDQCFYADEDAISPLWKGKRFPMSACVSGWVMLNRESVVIPDIEQDARVLTEAYRPTFVKSIAMVPIRSKAPIGAIGNYWAKPYRAHPMEIRLLQALADSTSVAIESIQIAETIRSEEWPTGQDWAAFSYWAAQDLKTPLSRVASFARLLSADYSDGLDSAGKLCVDRIHFTVEQVVGTVDSFLALSQLEKQPLNLRSVELAPLVERLGDDLRSEDLGHSVTLVVGSVGRIQADEGWIQKALRELLTSAWLGSVRHPSTGATVRFAQTIAPDGQGAFYVQAPGVCAEWARHGMGAELARKVIERHGGSIWSEPEQERLVFTLG